MFASTPLLRSGRIAPSVNAIVLRQRGPSADASLTQARHAHSASPSVNASAQWVTIQEMQRAARTARNKTSRNVGPALGQYTHVAFDGISDPDSSVFVCSWGSGQRSSVQRPKAAGHPSWSSATVNTEVRYDIDPISGRKVPRVDGSFTIPVRIQRSTSPARATSSASGRGRPQQSHNAALSEALIPTLEELGNYKPVRYQEPDGKPRTQSDYLAPSEEELNNYRSIRYNEPDGHFPGNADPLAPTQEELNAYREPYLYQEPDGHFDTAPDLAPTKAELEAYSRPFLYHEPDGHFDAEPYLAPTPAELESYSRPFMYHEPDGHFEPNGYMEPTQQELASYTAFRFNEPDGHFPESADVLSPTKSELAGYKAVRYNEPNGKPSSPRDTVRDSLRDFDGRSWISRTDFLGVTRIGQGVRRLSQLSVAPGCGAAPWWASTRARLAMFTTPAEEQKEDLDLLRASDVRAASGRTLQQRETEAEKDRIRRELDAQFYRNVATKDSAVDAWGFSREPKGLELSWQKEASESSLEPSLDRMQRAASTEDFYTKQPIGLETSYAEEVKAETVARAVADPYTHEPFGLETSYLEECRANGNEHPPVIYSPHGTPSADDVVGASSEQASGPLTLYRMCAWNPETKSLRTVETSSRAPDAAEALTPAEALTRLAHPAAFVAALASAQAGGWEIAAGAGQSLVFRKRD